MTKKQKEEISQKREKLALNISNRQLNEFNEDEIYNIQTILLDLVTKETYKYENDTHIAKNETTEKYLKELKKAFAFAKKIT